MITQATICGLLVVSHCLLASAYVSPMKLDGYTGLGDLEYVVKGSKEEAVNNPEMKERRSNVGSSFVRFGRARQSLFDDYDQSRDYPLDHPQTRSDVIIRYGRSDKKNSHKLRRSDSQFIRFGRNAPLDKDLRILCAEISMEETILERPLRFYPVELLRLCEGLSDETRLSQKIE